jgi:hypothetical protein
VSLVPIALGHAVAVATVLLAVFALGLVLDHAMLMRAAAVLLIAWALWHAIRGHRQRLRVGMQTGLASLVLWSFLMASAHGAGLMLVPILLPICASGAATSELHSGGAIPLAIAAAGIHSLTMLAAIGVISVAVYEWIGVGFLRRGWINLDKIWVAALHSVRRPARGRMKSCRHWAASGLLLPTLLFSWLLTNDSRQCW